MHFDVRLEALRRNTEVLYLKSMRRRMDETARRVEAAQHHEGRMNVDDRLEALSHSIELMSLNSRDSDKRMGGLREHMDEFLENLAALVTNSDRLCMLYTSQPHIARTAARRTC